MTAPIEATTSERKPSPILAMHKRYEETMVEYSLVERAESRARADHDEDEEDIFRRALVSLNRETDALRTALLHQVPDSWVDAMILQSHIVTAFDMQKDWEDVPAAELAALQTAIDTVFDFMCCTVEQDHGEIGAAFQADAVRVFYTRRRRTGVVED